MQKQSKRKNLGSQAHTFQESYIIKRQLTSRTRILHFTFPTFQNASLSIGADWLAKWLTCAGLLFVVHSLIRSNFFVRRSQEELIESDESFHSSKLKQGGPHSLQCKYYSNFVKCLVKVANTALISGISSFSKNSSAIYNRLSSSHWAACAHYASILYHWKSESGYFARTMASIDIWPSPCTSSFTTPQLL